MDTTQTKEDKTQTRIDATLEGNEPSPAKVEPAPEKSYRQSEVDMLLQQARMEAGRKWKSDLDAVTRERDDFKNQIQSKTDEINDISDEREQLKKQIDDLSSDDPAKFNLIKKERELREQESRLKTERRALETDKQTHAESVKLATETLREISIWEIASGYEGGNPVKLKELCDIFAASSDEQIKRAAGTLWAKKQNTLSEQVDTVVISKPDSAITSGGGTDYSNLSPREKIEKGLEKSRGK